MRKRSNARKLSGLVMGAAISTWAATGLAGCGPRTDSNERVGEVESCETEIRNDEWDVDCSAACNHVMVCKAATGDSDLETLSCGACLGSCIAGVSLGGNDLLEGTEEDRRSWECAALVEGCSALDHNCDIY